MSQLHAMLESSSPALVKVLHLVRTAPCNAVLIPLLYQGCWTYSAPWRWRPLALDALSGIQVKPPTAPSCALLLDTSVLHALLHEAHGIPELVHAKLFEACLRQRARSESAGLSSPRNIFQSILSLQLGLLQQSLIRRCSRVVT